MRHETHKIAKLKRCLAVAFASQRVKRGTAVVRPRPDTTCSCEALLLATPRGLFLGDLYR